jgi:ABC-type nitrate/sulfonate/bicarbonate transport system permease component
MPPVSQQLDLSDRDAGTADILLEGTRARRAATFRRVWRVAGPLLVLILLCLAWDMYVRAKGSFYLADSFSIFKATLSELGEGKVWSALLTSDLSLVMGFLAAVIVGVPLGLLIGRFRVIDKALAPYLQMALVTPMAVLMPIVLIALGLSRTAQVVVVFLFALPFIVVPTRGGVSTIPTEWTDMASAYGARELQAWRLVLIPGAIRAIVNGLRLGFAHALTGEITIELSLIAIGIGQLMIEYQSRYQAAELFAFVVIVSLQSLIVLNLLFLLEKRVTR